MDPDAYGMSTEEGIRGLLRERMNTSPRTQVGVSVTTGSVIHDVTKHRTCKASVVVPVGATASYTIEDAVLSTDAEGEEITATQTLTAGETNYINAPAFDGLSLIFKFTSDAALTVNISSH